MSISPNNYQNRTPSLSPNNVKTPGKKLVIEGQPALTPQRETEPEVQSKSFKKISDKNLMDDNMFINEKRGKVTNDYNILETIGKGGYGEVKKVIHKITGETRAMKIIKKESFDDS